MITKIIPNVLGTSVENRINGLSDYIHNPNQTRISGAAHKCAILFGLKTMIVAN